MIQFDRLRINGFKSFVDRTELEIGPGLNGIVGPNGCGKSNLVEALRWVMGESSAKRMRGGGMEDVIFNGTERRAKRNIAEVSILLDNATRTAPALYNSNDEIEIVRKIERDRGSNYKINDRNARARDVQMLFADTVTGANSPAMVSQGRVTQMINAKPLDRRLILEESAGISGLFARRHEAELRLKAADSNLLRMEDLLGSMQGRLGALKRQARQATRYRNISAQIRQMEILIAYMEWQALDERMKATRKSFEDAESIVADRLTVTTQLTKTQNTQTLDLPALRQAEAEAAAALQAQKLALQRLEDEASHQAKMLLEAREQMTQTTTDHQHATTELSENGQTLERMESEHGTIIAEQNSAEKKLTEKLGEKESLEDTNQKLEAQYNALMQSTAEIKAEKDSLGRRIRGNSTRLETLQRRQSDAEEELAQVHSRTPEEHTDFEGEIAALETRGTEAQNAISQVQSMLEDANSDIETAREDLRLKETSCSEFSAEINVLESFLNNGDEGEFSPVLDDILPDEGFEKALSRALGDSLMASLDKMATSIWLPPQEQRHPLPDLPDGALALLPLVKAPKALHASLSQIGVVEGDESGDGMWRQLKPGQSLVSRGGTYWRWDGYCIKSTAMDRHAQHLEQKNKLASLNARKPEIEASAVAARDTLENALEQRRALETTAKEKTEEKQAIENALTKKRAAWATQREEQARINSTLQRLQDTLETTRADIGELEALIREDQVQLEAYEDNKSASSQEDQLGALKEMLGKSRQGLSDVVRAFDLIQQQQSTRQARLHAIADERINLKNRSIRARERLKQLDGRRVLLEEKLTDLDQQPSDFEEKKEHLLGALSRFEKVRDVAAEKLAACEAAVAETNRALKDAEKELGQSREARAHAQATLSAILEQREGMDAVIHDKFEMKPEDLPQHCAIDMDKEWGDLDSLRQKREKMTRERDGIGPVNLRAEDEATELEREVGAMLHERNDLTQAIDELRGGISKLNKEARERLLAAFEHVNAHFSRLFVQLFGGGHAHLALIDSDDPLKSGLEIFAQPPGKALQSLSLLSGGEQTLASIALIFAMFLTNPSPICVLDEIDAPLDDANVDRVCDLLDTIAERGETRFLVITHHRLTMARMDRLYGVTMAERGISQLVSVDLQQSFDFIEAA